MNSIWKCHIKQQEYSHENHVPLVGIPKQAVVHKISPMKQLKVNEY